MSSSCIFGITEMLTCLRLPLIFKTKGYRCAGCAHTDTGPTWNGKAALISLFVMLQRVPPPCVFFRICLLHPSSTSLPFSPARKNSHIYNAHRGCTGGVGPQLTSGSFPPTSRVVIPLQLIASLKQKNNNTGVVYVSWHRSYGLKNIKNQRRRLTSEKGSDWCSGPTSCANYVSSQRFRCVQIDYPSIFWDAQANKRGWFST